MKLCPNSTNKALTSPHSNNPNIPLSLPCIQKAQPHHSASHTGQYFLPLPYRENNNGLFHRTTPTHLQLPHLTASLTGEYLSTITSQRKPQLTLSQDNLSSLTHRLTTLLPSKNNTFLPLPKRHIHNCLFHITTSNNLQTASFTGQNLPVITLERKPQLTPSRNNLNQFTHCFPRWTKPSYH